MSTDIRSYDVTARSTDVFGRVLCSARDHHFIVDGPVQNGCPGEEVTPAELFLAGVAACGVELIQVLGRQAGIEIPALRAKVHGMIDRAHPVRPDHTVFNSVRVELEFQGVAEAQAFELAEAFKKR
jgi:uncharacterized OsmC-like protein